MTRILFSRGELVIKRIVVQTIMKYEDITASCSGAQLPHNRGKFSLHSFLNASIRSIGAARQAAEVGEGVGVMNQKLPRDLSRGPKRQKHERVSTLAFLG